MIKATVYTLCIIIAAFSCHAVFLSEIMYNPLGNDNNKEFIEVCSQQNISLEGYTIEDLKSSDSLELVKEFNSSCALIVEQDYNHSLLNASIYSVGATIGDNLNNDEDLLILRNEEGTLIDLVYYSSNWGGNDGYSLERVSSDSLSTDPNNWKNSLDIGGSPGIRVQEETIMGCDWNVSLSYDLSEYYSTGDLDLQLIAQKINGEKTNISSVLLISDIFGNIVKEYTPFTNHSATSKKSSSRYNPVLKDDQAYLISGSVLAQCEDSDLSNNNASFLLLPNEQEREEESSLVIDGFLDLGSDHTASYGQTIRSKLVVYKGNTNKKVVTAHAEINGKRISKESKITIDEKYSTTEVAIPLQLIPNCNEKYPSGQAELIVSGLDAHDSEHFDISGTTSSLCEIVKVEKTNKRGKIRYEIIDMPGSVDLETPFFITLRIENDDDDDTTFSVWSYVYRGSKKYTPEKENLRHLHLDSYSVKEIRLPLTMNEGTSGTYKLKVKLLKEGRKTSDDKTREILLSASVSEITQAPIVLSQAKEDLIISEPTVEKERQVIRANEIIYESNAFFHIALIPYLLIFLFSLSLIFSVLRK